MVINMKFSQLHLVQKVMHPYIETGSTKYLDAGIFPLLEYALKMMNIKDLTHLFINT